jgi:hypothetical protein
MERIKKTLTYYEILHNCLGYPISKLQFSVVFRSTKNLPKKDLHNFILRQIQ